MRRPLTLALLAGLLSPLAASAATPINQLGDRAVRITGLSAGDQLGFAVAGIGDLNGDGLADIAIGTPGRDRSGATDVGTVYVVFGRANPAASIDLNGLNGSNGFVLTGTALPANARLGQSLSTAGDINGDGVPDLIVGSGLNSLTGNTQASAFVVYGRQAPQTFPATLDVSALNGTNGFALQAEAAVHDFGAEWGVAGGGDFNGDSFDDVVIGARRAGSGGRAYVVYGRSSFTATVTMASLTATTGFRLTTTAATVQLGAAVALGSRVNNDGFAELLVGSPAAFSGAGAAYVVYGGDNLGANLDIVALTGGNGFALRGGAGEAVGVPVGFAGDINDDGPEDLLIGATGPAASRRAYAVYGNFAGFDAEVLLPTLTAQRGFRMVAPNDGAGFALSRAEDVSGDGIVDFLVVGDAATVGGQAGAGRIWQVNGSLGGPAELDLNAIDTDPSRGEVFTGSVAGQGQFRVANAGKFNGDKRSDFLIGNPAGNEVWVVLRPGLSADRVFCNRFEASAGC